MNFNILTTLLLLTVFSSCRPQGSDADPKTGKAETAKIVFKSTDGGQTWQDISKGLPEDLNEDSMRGYNVFANDKGLFLKVGNGLYHNLANTTGANWTKEIFSDTLNSITPANSGKFSWGVNLKKTDGTSIWSPILEDSQEIRLRSAFETKEGAIFISTDRGLLKTVDNGNTWKRVHTQGMDAHLAESNGILVGISMRKMIRSTDDGETWAWMPSEDAVSWDVKSINGVFVASTSSTASSTRRLSTSYDGGETWQSLHSPLKDKVVIDSIGRTWDDRPRVRTFITSITQVGENFFGSNPQGLFKSSDKGKTWKLLLPSVKDKIFNLFVSGDVIYAIPSRGGC